MPDSLLRATLKLNRWLACAFAIALLAPSLSRTFQASWWVAIGLLAFNGLFLLANEFTLRYLKRIREPRSFAQIGNVAPYVLLANWALHYLAMPTPFFVLMGLFPALQAFLLGQAMVGNILGTLIFGGIALGQYVLHYHQLEVSAHQQILILGGFGGCMLYYGLALSHVVRTHHLQMDKLQSMAATDVLTGLTNRRQFNTRLHEEIARARRHQTPLTLALFDIDHFKTLNDKHGHPVGDRILSELATLIKKNVRESDLPARYGGEEFALILPETREQEGYDLLERIRQLIAQTVFCLPDNPVTITMSIGIAQMDSKRQSAFEFVDITDKALYEAKRLGRNQVVKASGLSASARFQALPERIH